MRIFHQENILSPSTIQIIRKITKSCITFFSLLFFWAVYLLKKFRFRVFAAGTNIGHFSEEPATYLREQALGRVSPFRTILFPPFKSIFSKRPLQQNFCNPYLCHLWKQHFYVVTNPWVAFFLRPLLSPRSIIYFHDYCTDKPGKSTHSVHREYYQQHPYTPTLSLPAEDIEKGEAVLKLWGIKNSDWFVCFHAREPGYYVSDDLIRCGVRNTNMATYELALAEISNRGGWCIRVGSPKSPPLPASIQRIPRVIDYPLTPFVSDFLDIFLLSRCRFLLGSQSGIINVPGLFSVPTVLTNAFPINNMPLYPSDLAILKTYKCKLTGKMIPFTEAFRSRLAYSTETEDYEELQVEVVDNTAKEVLDVVLEMLDRLDGKFSEENESEELHEKFRRLIPKTIRSKDAVSRIGLQFLREKRHLY